MQHAAEQAASVLLPVWLQCSHPASKVLHSVATCCILPAWCPTACLLQVAMDMSNDEVGEAEDLMEAYWLLAGAPFPFCCIPGAAPRCPAA